jgi:acyl-CoA synthetase (AMP-forming)/AMP-acid ligase II
METAGQNGETLQTVLTAGEPDRVALRSEDGRTLTARALHDGVERLAAELAGADVRRGDRVVLVLPNGPEFVQILLAVTALGAAAAPLNPAYTVDECAFYIEDLSPTVVIVPAGEADAARQAASGVPLLDLELGSDAPRLSRQGGQLTPRAEFERCNPDDIALLLHTSGTTSRPKQVPLLHRNLMASARAIAAHYELGPEDTAFAAMPLFHVHGLVASVLAQLLGGGCVVAPVRLSASRFWTELSTGGVSWFSGSPTVLTMLLDRRTEGAGAPSLRFVRSCSAALSTTLAARLESALEVPALQAYGMTEASHQIASNPLPPAPHDPASVGPATGTRIAIVDGDGNDRPPGEAGEVLISGPGVMGGYLNSPQANAEAFVGERLRTGDLGSIDERGYVRLVGRLKELINRGGEKISPFEVEEVLRQHPAVGDVACFAIPDPKYGEAVAAAVILAGDADTRELRDFCRERLAAFKVPRELRTIDALPKTATGKVQRARLADWFQTSAR